MRLSPPPQLDRETGALEEPRRNRCSGARVPAPPALDLDREPGAETWVEQVAGCPAGVDVRLFTLRGGPHVPAFATAFGEWSTAWLEAHPKVAAPGRDRAIIEKKLDQLKGQ